MNDVLLVLTVGECEIFLKWLDVILKLFDEDL
jgi:hypothetical protein